MHKEDCPWKSGFEMSLIGPRQTKAAALMISDCGITLDVDTIDSYFPEQDAKGLDPFDDPDDINVTFKFCPMCGEKQDEA